MLAFLKEIINEKFRLYYFKLSLFCFNLQEKKQDVNKIYSFAAKHFSKPIPFWQIEYEICSLISFIKEKKPTSFLEIGTAGGGSLFMILQVIPTNAVLISLDLPFGEYGGGYPESRISIYRAMAKSKQRIELIREDSHSQSAFLNVQQLLNGNKLDFIFIDGDHSYEGVKTDFQLYSKLIKKDGYIAFHDIVPGPIEHVGGVPTFWSEIKGKYKHIEFVKDWNQKGYGIGILFMDKSSK